MHGLLPLGEKPRKDKGRKDDKDAKEQNGLNRSQALGAARRIKGHTNENGTVLKEILCSDRATAAD